MSSRGRGRWWLAPLALVILAAGCVTQPELKIRHDARPAETGDGWEVSNPAAEGLDPAVFTAGDIMSVDLVMATPDMDSMDAVQLMKTHRLRRLVMTDDAGGLVGIVTMEDVLELLTRELANLAAGLAGARDREINERA